MEKTLRQLVAETGMTRFVLRERGPGRDNIRRLKWGDDTAYEFGHVVLRLRKRPVTVDDDVMTYSSEWKYLWLGRKRDSYRWRILF